MTKDFIKRALFVIALFSLGYIGGYFYAKHEIAQKALADKKTCYDLLDIQNLLK
jgi:hypothetical protein